MAADDDMLPVGVRPGPVTVRVPASSANLGPGFDSLGLALGLYDELVVEALPPAAGLTVTVEGEGADDVPLTEEHLVVRAIRSGLARAGVGACGLRLHCRNLIPHGRGLGSSASAAVGGLVAARGLLVDPSALDPQTVLELADGFEGHPDNVAASVYGGFTISWVGAAGARAVSLPVHPDVVAVACVPSEVLATSKARAMLPPSVGHADAAFNAGRSALLVHALTRDPSLLLDATEDRLHQDQRASAMPATLDLVRQARAAGLAAVVSGAGPTALVFARGQEQAAQVAALAGPAWRVLVLDVDASGTVVVE